jgi:osmotically-inducible protein OsmY
MTDKQMQDNVLAALKWEPSIDNTQIGVTVNQGIVALRGEVRSLAEKMAAERVALRVYGVKGVANDLVVHFAGSLDRSDTDIALAVVNALKWNSQIPPNTITPTVSNGWVTLKGELDWNYQREVAAKAVRDLLGVRGVSNEIGIRPRVSVADVEAKIEAALKRSAEVDARRIHVGATDGKVVLTGNVRSWAERVEVERAAWAAPGVKSVEDHLSITP